MAVWYLDTDDEITDAVARLRSVTDERVVFVVPPGSRIATGRINFRLLAREARSRGLAMAIASPDEQVRSLAASAGVLGLATVDAAQAALDRGDTVAEVETGSAEHEAAGTEPGTDATPGAVLAPPPLERSTVLRAGGRRLTAAVVAVLALVVVGAVASLEVLPTAEITLVPRTATIGPLESSVVATPDTEDVDIEAGTIPAVQVSIPLTASIDFQATGSETVARRAAGVVEFSSSEQSFDQVIEAGTRVLTEKDIEFRTTAPVVLRRPADGVGPARVSAPVEAVDPGEDANVLAGAISVVPSLDSQGISVTNPDATGGGEFRETPIVTQDDYIAATVDLENRLKGALATRLRDPSELPEGLTLFPETQRLGPVRYDPEVSEVVGTSAPQFSLTATADGQALAVDESLVDEVAESRLRSQVPAGMAPLERTLRVEREPGVAGDDQIAYQASAAAEAYLVIDADEIRSQVAGLPVSEALAILEESGSATVDVWPDFVGNLPDDRERIGLEIQEPPTTE